MAVVIGRNATRVSREEARNCVAGVTILTQHVGALENGVHGG